MALLGLIVIGTNLPLCRGSNGKVDPRRCQFKNEKKNVLIYLPTIENK